MRNWLKGILDSRYRLFQAFVPLAPAPASSKLGALYGSTNLADFLSKLFAASISIGAILAVLRLGYAGYVYMTSDAWNSKHHAKEVIGDVTLGLLLLLSIYLILWQINPDILNLNFLRSVSTPTTSSTNAQTVTNTSSQQNTLFGGAGGANNIQKDSSTGKCYIPNDATGGLDETACP